MEAADRPLSHLTLTSRLAQNLVLVPIKPKKRKYCDEYLNLRFVQAGTDIEQKPQCVLCYEILSNEAMKPAKLRRHLETKHSEFSGKSIEFF